MVYGIHILLEILNGISSLPTGQCQAVGNGGLAVFVWSPSHYYTDPDTFNIVLYTTAVQCLLI